MINLASFIFLHYCSAARNFTLIFLTFPPPINVSRLRSNRLATLRQRHHPREGGWRVKGGLPIPKPRYSFSNAVIVLNEENRNKCSWLRSQPPRALLRHPLGTLTLPPRISILPRERPAIVLNEEDLNEINAIDAVKYRWGIALSRI